jgi:hypothetical protein
MQKELFACVEVLYSHAHHAIQMLVYLVNRCFEFLPKNFLFLICHSRARGTGWYLPDRSCSQQEIAEQMFQEKSSARGQIKNQLTTEDTELSNN